MHVLDLIMQSLIFFDSLAVRTFTRCDLIGNHTVREVLKKNITC